MRFPFRATVAGALVLATAALVAQEPDARRDVPGAAAYARMRDRLRDGPAFVSGALNVLWASDSQSFTYTRGGQRRRFTIAARAEMVDGPEPAAPARNRVTGPDSDVFPGADPCPVAIVDRGRQRSCEASPDRTQKAYTRDRNLYLSRADGSGELALTRDGGETARVKYGEASWVYGEELEQTSAIWWSPDSRRVAFYRFDERPVRDYYVTIDQTRVQSRVDTEAYPKAGTDNPIADVWVYDTAARSTTRIDVRGGKPFSDDVMGHYVYGLAWAPDGRELRLFRTDRRQQHLEYVGCQPVSGACRVIVREDWPTGWIENHPLVRYLADNRHFILASERTGWRNYYVGDADSGAITPITHLTTAEAGSIVRVDETARQLYYMARDGDSFMKWQLHRVGLDGRDDTRLTDPRFTHTVRLSPDGRYFVDVYQSHDQPPASRLVDARGEVVAELAASDLTRVRELSLRPVEQFSYLAADGRTRLYGNIAFPSTFDPRRRYPVLVSVYGGPEAADGVPAESFSLPPAIAEYGFLTVTLGTRAAPGLGRRTLDELYLKLGRTEIDDLAEGVKAIRDRPYVDAGHVGIYGTSYGGYAALMCLLRYPQLFAAASVSSAPTDWRHYDTIYTERYMWTPQGNAAGYDAGSAMTYASTLQGRLLIYYGTADNNVHPSNALQLMKALNTAGKSYDVQIGPDMEHSAVPFSRMMEFFVDALVSRPDSPHQN
ncbi:MAG: DPP IV N-terminal domain-containing protein [Acidobacteriota bacterium]